MNATRLSLLFAAVLGSIAAVAGGCNLVLGTGYVVGAADSSTASSSSGSSSSSGGPQETGSPDAGTPDGGGDACAVAPQNKQQFESYPCTNASCAPFDNVHDNPDCNSDGGDGGINCPPLPPYDAGASSPPTGAAMCAADAGPTIDAGTKPSCFHLTTGPAGGVLPQPVVFATGSTAIQPYMARVAQALENIGAMSVVYLGAGSCFGVNAMYDPNDYTYSYISTTTSTPYLATYYDSALDSNGNVQQGSCVIDDPCKVADLGISDVFPTTCLPQLASQGGLPNNLHDFAGPVQTMEMVVPAASQQTSISSEAAYMVWGFGNGSGVSPWTDQTFLLRRSASSGTQNMIAKVIGVPADQWVGVSNGSSGNIVTEISNINAGKALDGGPGSDPNAAQKTMGILASDVADTNRQAGVLKPLAFQDVGESCGWFPDSTQTSYDKQNVRDGHYPIWGPSHLVAYSDSNGNETNSAVKTLIDSMNGRNTTLNSTLDIVQFYAHSHIVPTCAMHVQRAQDGSDYTAYTPPVSCSCYYDLEATGQAPATCTSCKSDADCKSAPAGATTCVLDFGIPPVGYCEPPGSGQ